MFQPRSIQRGLGLKLGGLLGVFGLFCAAFISFQLSQIDETARHLRLRQQSDDLVAAISLRAGALSFALNEAAARQYAIVDPQEFYAVWDEAGPLLAASSSEFTVALEGISGGRPPPLGDSGGVTAGEPESPIYSLTSRVDIGGRMLRVAVGHRAWAGDRLLREIEITLLQRTAWVAAPIGLLVLCVSVLIVRRAFEPMRVLTRQAIMIGPDTPGLRLAHPRLPDELSQLIQATNDAAARLESALTRQLRFTADAAHQLQTPLAILSARLECDQDSNTSTQTRADIRRMSHLIDRLLQMSQTSGRIETSATLDLTTIARETVSALVPRALAQGKTLSLSAPSARCPIDGAPFAVGEALSNLLENALQHSPIGGSVDVEVTAAAAVTVTDDGPGLCPSSLSRIFEPFFTTRRHDGGSGLGLAIAAEIMQRHGGSVTAANHPYRGAVFTLQFQPKLIELKRVRERALREQSHAVA